jgi:hypothetical protein
MTYKVIGTTIVDTSRNLTVSSLGVNTTASGTPGEIRATNNITAYYSDERLKNKIATIANPLDKISSLTGFYYKANDVAASYGYETENIQIGLSAQEVKREFSEIVTLAPFDSDYDENGKLYSVSGNEYLTLDYAKLVPVLVEAIKELKAELELLKTQK